MKQNYTKEAQFAYPFNINGKQPAYTTSQHKLFYTWKEGEEVNLAFEINPIFRAMPVVITIYNSKYQDIYTTTEYPDLNCNVYLNIDTATSLSVFKSGQYYCEVAANTQVGDGQYKYILIPANGCILQVTKIC